MRGYQTQDESRGESLEALTKEFGELLEDSRALKRELAIVRTLSNEHRRVNNELNRELTRLRLCSGDLLAALKLCESRIDLHMREGELTLDEFNDARTAARDAIAKSL